MSDKNFYELQEEELLNPTPIEAKKKNVHDGKKKKAKVPNNPTSNAQKKRLAKMIEKKQKKANRGELLEKLSKSTFVVPDSEKALYKASNDLGKSRETTRESLRRALLEQRAGLPQSNANVILLKEYDRSATDSDDTDDAENVSPDVASALSFEASVIPVDEVSSLHQKSQAVLDKKRRQRQANKQKKKAKRSLLSSKDNTTISVDDDNVGESQHLTEPAAEESSSTPCQISTTATTNDNSPAYYVNVERDEAIQTARLELPIMGEEQVIMETIQANLVTVLCGETGSGKSTQVPQFLYEAGYGHAGSQHSGLIGITQPRRVAAISLAHRVAEELGGNHQHGQYVAYQIRYENTLDDKTRIKFMTDGVLLKEISNDFLLRKYSILLLDEAHERNLNTDILIGLLSRIIPLRAKMAKTGEDGITSPLRLVIMSATLRIDDFVKNSLLFPIPPPIVRVDARQFPVTIHFNRVTPLDDYVNAAYEKICKIHKKLPPGGILVFLTGQSEIQSLCRRLRRRFPEEQSLPLSNSLNEAIDPLKQGKPASQKQRKKESFKATSQSNGRNNKSMRDELIREALEGGGEQDIFEALSDNEEEELLDIRDEDYHGEEIDQSTIEWENYGSDEDDDMDKRNESDDDENMPYGGAMNVLPLYSLLSPELQMRVFQQHTDKSRLCVIATNVAETSLTIPGISYVVDIGRSKEKQFDSITGIQTYKVTWISKASADQRAGRAGRTSAGHCYRLYSSAVYENNFQLFSLPEILRMPIEGTVLQLKSMHIDHAINFPFPTSPDRLALVNAEKLLVHLQCLNETTKKVTDMGEMASHFPLSPRFAKMLVIGRQQGCLPYIIAIVSAMSVGDPFIRELNSEESSNDMNKDSDASNESSKEKRISMYKRHQELAGTHPVSDLLKLLTVILKYDQSTDKSRFCQSYFLREKAMQEIRKLRQQLTAVYNKVQPELQLVTVDPYLESPTELQCTFLRQIILSGFIDQVARRKEHSHRYEIANSDEDIFIHPTSCLFHATPEWIMYKEIIRTSKLYVKDVSIIELSWLQKLAPSMCQFSKLLEQPSPFYDDKRDEIFAYSEVTFGNKEWKLPMAELPYPKGMERFKWFAEALLEGKVISGFKSYQSWYINRPTLMRKSWNLPRITNLLLALMNEGVDSRETILSAWKKNPLYLKNALLEWLPADKHSLVSAQWPPKAS